MDYEGRQSRLRDWLIKEELLGLYVSKITNIRYLCGFTGSSGHLLVSPEGSRFLSDERYRTQAAQEVQGADFDIYGVPDEMGPALAKGAGDLKISKVGFEAEHMPVVGLEKLEGYLEGIQLVPTVGSVEALRRVKEPEEIVMIREAAALADRGFAHIVQRIEVGKSERELALDLEFFMRGNGAEGVSFDLIVAAAERSALPHAHATDREVEKGRIVLFDLGCKIAGYCSDLTRTVIVGPIDDRHRETYELVLSAQQAGLEAIRPGAAGAEVDGAARKVIDDAGAGQAFGHGLGHGVGLEVHEAPTLRRTSTDILEPGNVVTDEPGVYFPGWGGVRIEDLVLVTAEGRDVLSAAPKELLVL